MFEIEKGVPMPQSAKNKRYPWKELEVGDSFLYPGQNYNSLAHCASRAGKMYGRKFACRKTPEGWRVWRVA